MKKRASVHVIEGSSTSERLSLAFNHSRRRSFSESWTFLSTSNLTPLAPHSRNSSLSLGDDDCDESSHSSGSTAASTPTSSSPIPPASLLSGNLTSLKDVAYKDLPDQELLKSLAAFLKGGSRLYDEDEEQVSATKATKALTETCSREKQETYGLVVTVRDFAYPKSHPYHFGNYPPEPVYEESEVDEEEFEEDNKHLETNEADSFASSSPALEEGRTSGHARGLYDFDAENSTELTFKEGDYLWIHCRQFPGWFLGEMNGTQGLVPSNYVELI
ncbi:HOG (high osmolarity glycerol) pathway protein [Mortierella sp. AM989]|nr:HOG (high osmolarity glycerol) pathway protein [Mortierella sp. AM989]